MQQQTMGGTTGPLTGRVRAARQLLNPVTGLFPLLLLGQAYLAGLFLMSGSDIDFRTAHEALGWSLTYYPFLTLAVASIAKAPREFWLSFTVLFVLIHVQPFFVFLSASDGLGWARAMHPLNGVVLVVLAVHHFRLARSLDR